MNTMLTSLFDASVLGIGMMVTEPIITIAYIVASVLFILSLRGLSSQETASQGNLYGILGMLIAVGACMTDPSVTLYGPLVPALIVGALIGGFMAKRVAMTGMPELVALLHSFVGAAAVLVGFATYLKPPFGYNTVFLIEVYVDVFIGSITFTGSVIAYLKLKGSMSGKPLLIPARHLVNLGMVIGCIFLAIMYVDAGGNTDSGMTPLLIMTVIACILGVHLVAAIGGADMPVVVSMLNSYSGWTASAAGFMLSNDLLIITGALVGSSGAILSYIMCKAMNRSIVSVIFGGFGTGGGAAPAAKSVQAEAGEATLTDADTVVAELSGAKEVVIVPGYGMAVARAQHAVRDLTEHLRGNGVNVRFAIHPVAGRLPGHMNVLLAEANVPYDIVLEMEEINEEFGETDVCLVIGANDIVNPAANDDPGCPIYGMPVCHVWEAKRTVVFKRSLASGYAGIDNPLFYHERSRMLLGDAKASVESLVNTLRG